jgi:serine protease Do
LAPILQWDVEVPIPGVIVPVSPCNWFSAIGLMFLAAAGSAFAHEPAASVVRVRAVGTDGSVKFGSGVVIAPGQVATACHVTRGATTIEVEHAGKRSTADAQHGSPYHDLCLLSVQAVDAPAVPARRSGDLSPGETVIAIGFEGGGKVVENAGSVAALYDFDEGRVIRTSAAFDFGSSGGGLFDQDGNLVGILAFKARTGANLRFALPTEWLSPVSHVAGAFISVAASEKGAAFWEGSRDNRPAFLGVARSEAAGK